MKNSSKAFYCVFILQSISLPSEAQDQYRIDLGSDKVTVYTGYINFVQVRILNPDNPSDYDYKFHAQADGADIDYESNGRMKYLPKQRNSSLKIFAEKNGKFYNVQSTLRLEGVKAPVNDGTFISVMGISKDDPKTSIKNPKHFTIPKNKKAEDSNLEAEWFMFNSLRRDEPSMVKVKILLKKDTLYIPQQGEIEMRSTDANVRKVNKNTFEVKVLAARQRCRLSIFLDDKKISDEVVDVYPLIN